MRADDRLRLFELHSTDVATLADNFREAGRQVMVTNGDGLAGLKALVPPPPRRALALIDPSYEVASDYRGVVKTLSEALARFPTGTFAVWYPILAKPEARALPEKLRALGAKSWLDVTLTVRKQPPGTFGMPGSGMFVINPPWTLEKTLNETMPWLVDALKEDEGAAFTLTSLAN